MAKMATLGSWTPKRAHGFCKRRLDKIEQLLGEIAYVYSDVDNTVDLRCTEAREGGIAAIRESIDYALETGAQL